MGRIIVGVDGSEVSARALRWAVDHAEPDDIIETICVVERPPVDWVMPIEAAPMPQIDWGEVEEIAESKLERVIRDVVGTEPPAKIERNVLVGSPGQLLVDASQGADMVVVGSRGLGGFRGLLLGSVSHKLTSHAHCPVVVIPHDEE